MSKSTAQTEIPEHILDMVPERANAYANTQQERWLAGLNDQEKAKTL